MWNRRCWETVGCNGELGRPPGRARGRPAGALAQPGRRRPSRAPGPWPGRRSASSTASTTSPTADGSRRGAHSSGIRSRGTASLSRITWPRSRVEMPSTRIWWDLDRIANRPSSRPSIRYISHSGRLRSSGRAMIRATRSSSCVHRARTRHRGLAHVVGQVEVVVVDPHRRGEAARHVEQPLAVARHEGEPVADQRDQARRSRSRPGRGRRPRRSPRAWACWPTRCPAGPRPPGAAAPPAHPSPS